MRALLRRLRRRPLPQPVRPPEPRPGELTLSAEASLVRRPQPARADDADDAELDTLRGELVRELGRMARRPGNGDD